MPAIAACGCSTYNLGVIVTSGHTPGREVLDLHRRPAPVGVACDLVAPALIPKGARARPRSFAGRLRSRPGAAAARSDNHSSMYSSTTSEATGRERSPGLSRSAARSSPGHEGGLGYITTSGIGDG